ncbi:MAG TPA: YgcG family protein [Verrucomicrobiae bacterium]|nr:YgcG family protein [Verrucomicrobiae bacterium]
MFRRHNCRIAFRSKASSLLAFLIVVLLAGSLAALEVPPLKGRVNDYAGLLPPERASALEHRLEQFENSTGHQIVVLTVPSLEGEDIEGFGIKVAEKWKIGKKGFDNGAILIISQKDRRLRIEVGYGLEGVLPDAIANRIIEEQITPRFRDGDFPGGIEAGVDAIMKVTQGEPLPEAQRRKPSSNFSRFPFGLILPLLFLAFFILSSFGSRRRGIWAPRGPRYYGPGGFFGGGLGGGGGWGGGGGGGFSGGGGGFGGGGASGSW